jgi:hypothetical protein
MANTMHNTPKYNAPGNCDVKGYMVVKRNESI